MLNLVLRIVFVSLGLVASHMHIYIYICLYIGATNTSATYPNTAPTACATGGQTEREGEIKFIGLFEDRGHRGPYSPYKLFNHNLYIRIIIFPHIDNPQSTGYN